MVSRLARSAVCFLVVLVMYWLYLWLLVPWLEPQVNFRSGQSVGRRMTATRRSALPAEMAALFPQGSWELADPKVLETPQGILLIKDFQPRPDGSVELRPCTVVFHSQSEQRRPVIIQSPEGAVLRFDPPLQLAQARIGRLVGGYLSGEITVRCPPSAKGTDDELEIKTKSMQVQQDRIWTPHDVEFRMGQNSGRGRDLSILLDSGDRRRRPSLGSSQVKMLQLAHLERVQLTLHGDMLHPSSEPQAATQDDYTQLHVTCQGPFQFDFVRRAAVLHQKVDVLRIHRDGPDDQLNCERLTLYFDTPGGEESGRGPNSLSTRNLSGMKLQLLVAEGFPVMLRAPSMDASARCERLQYDLKTRTVRLDDQHQAVLDYAPRQLRVSGRSITLQPDGQHQLLSIIQGATVASEQAGTFRAEQIHIWMAEGTSAEQGRVKRSPRPERILALDRVHIDSPRLIGDTHRLEAWIDYATVISGSAAASDLLAHSPPAGGLRADTLDPSSASTQFTIAGDLIKLQLVQRSDEMLVQDVTVQDHVQLGQATSSTPGQKPLHIQGDLLRVLRGDQRDSEIHIVGRPAIASARGAQMQGQRIQVLRATNQLQIPGPGTMTVGVDEPSAANSSTVHWDGSMQFDGRTAHFRQNVRASGIHRLKTGELLNVSTLGQQLDVTLDRSIDFSQLKKTDQRVQVYSFTFVGPTVMENSTVDQGQLVSRDKMQLRNLQVNHQSGEIFADGPGWLQSVHLSDDLLGEQPGDDRSRTRTGQPKPKSTKFLRVDFEKEMSGNVLDRHLRFVSNVRTLYGPVPNWDSELQVRQRDDLGQHGMLMTSDLLDVMQVGPMSDDQVPVELVAQGNVIVEGRRYAARAARISYVRTKDLLLLEGDGRSDAQLWMSGKSAPDATARRILYSRRHHRIEGGDFRYVDLSRLGIERIQSSGQ